MRQMESMQIRMLTEIDRNSCPVSKRLASGFHHREKFGQILSEIADY